MILSDIELLDGNAFEIYNQVSVNCPIIFTTAYNQYLMDAFESNGISYLLKPFTLDRFLQAWKKFTTLRTQNSQEKEFLRTLHQLVQQTSSKEKQYKSRFSVSSHKGTYFLEVAKIAYFSSEEGVVFAIDTLGKRHMLTVGSLKELEVVLDPMLFFRINRSEVVHKNQVERIERYTKNSLAVWIQGHDKFLLTSQSNTAPFKDWLEV